MADERIDKIQHKRDTLSRRRGMQPNAACTFIVSSSFVLKFEEVMIDVVD